MRAGGVCARWFGQITVLRLTPAAATNWEHDADGALAAVEESIALTHSGAVDAAYGAALVISARLRASSGDRVGVLERSRDAIDYSHRVGDHNNGA